MLKQRIATALVLVVIFLGSLLLLPPPWFIALVTLTFAIGGWEWARLSGISRRSACAAYVAVLLLIIASLYGWLQTAGAESARQWLHGLVLLGAGWWALALLWVQGYPSSALLWGSRPCRAVTGLLVLIPAWAAILLLLSFPRGEWLVLLVVAVVAVADMGGYFVGRRFGRRKLAVEVSPGKTIEGLLGGLSANILFGLVLYFIAGWQSIALLALLAVIVVVSLVSVLGDLFESMVKRHAGVKDSGTILPGHGGILDRIDGLVAALPVFAVVYMAMVGG